MPPQCLAAASVADRHGRGAGKLNSRAWFLRTPEHRPATCANRQRVAAGASRQRHGLIVPPRLAPADSNLGGCIALARASLRPNPGKNPCLTSRCLWRLRLRCRRISQACRFLHHLSAVAGCFHPERRFTTRLSPSIDWWMVVSRSHIHSETVADRSSTSLVPVACSVSSFTKTTIAAPRP